MSIIYRNEDKYHVNRVTFTGMRPKLKALLREDPHNPAYGGYHVRSVYFDALYDNDLFEACNGMLSKQKVRLRTYDTESETCNLEFKCKTGTRSNKRSISISRGDARRMLRGDYAFLKQTGDVTAIELYSRMKAMVYRPKCLITYRREAYLADINDLRVTYDYDVGVCADVQEFWNPKAPCLPISEPDTGTLEVKYNFFIPEHVRSLLQQMNLTQIASSKYVTGRLAV